MYRVVKRKGSKVLGSYDNLPEARKRCRALGHDDQFFAIAFVAFGDDVVYVPRFKWLR